MSLAHYPNLAHQIVFVTGGASGIGAAIVKAFAAQGCQVAFIDLDDTRGPLLCEVVASEGFKKPLFLSGDVSCVATIKASVAQVVQQLGGIDVLVNNAANDQRHTTQEVSEALWDRLMGINLRQQFFAAQAAIPSMIKRGGGSIINMGSNCYLLAQLPVYPLYATAKSAVLGLTRSLASEFGEHHIRVNCVMPGWTMTERQIEKWLTPEAEKQLMKEQCIKDRISPDDIARTVLFLASEESRMITKQCIVVDGGRI